MSALPSAVPVIYGLSPLLLQPPSFWSCFLLHLSRSFLICPTNRPKSVSVCGFFIDEPSLHVCPAYLDDFLKRGEKDNEAITLVTFGSMASLLCRGLLNPDISSTLRKEVETPDALVALLLLTCWSIVRASKDSPNERHIIIQVYYSFPQHNSVVIAIGPPVDLWVFAGGSFSKFARLYT